MNYIEDYEPPVERPGGTFMRGRASDEWTERHRAPLWPLLAIVFAVALVSSCATLVFSAAASTASHLRDDHGAAIDVAAVRATSDIQSQDASNGRGAAVAHRAEDPEDAGPNPAGTRAVAAPREKSPPASVPPDVSPRPGRDDPATILAIASWYGPGFYGNTTACGQIYTPEIRGVAHKTLPCGTLVGLAFGGRIVFVPVIDRGPFIDGRMWDLSRQTREDLGCTDLCPVRWWIP